MERSGRDGDTVPDPNLARFISDKHGPLSLLDIINLLGLEMSMGRRLLSRGDGRLRQALRTIGVDRRMHELPDYRSIAGNIGLRIFAIAINHPGFLLGN